jgi:hypothetical protein
MNYRNDNKHFRDNGIYGEPAGGRGKGSAKIATAAKVLRAITAVVVFGIPMVTGAAALLGYGVHKAYKRITGKP